MDEAKWGTMRWGYFRWGVFRDDWDTLLKVFEGVASHDVTRRRLVLGDTRDSITGWYPRSFTETTVEGVLIPRASSHLALKAGTYVRTDALFLTADGFEEGDELEDGFSKFWEVKAIREISIGDSFRNRECDLSSIPLHGLSYSTVAPTVEDARSRTKTYWETYLDDDNLQNKGYIVAFSDPDYPLLKVFKDKGIGFIFTIDQPDSEALIGHAETPYGYQERVPTHVLTLDTKMQWLGERELRRITESYSTGSQRRLGRKISHDRWLGSTRLYDTEFPLIYLRDRT